MASGEPVTSSFTVPQKQLPTWGMWLLPFHSGCCSLVVVPSARAGGWCVTLLKSPACRTLFLCKCFQFLNGLETMLVPPI
jgi:hypothetical protein